MNIEQAMALTEMRKQSMAVSFNGRDTKTAKQIADIVFDLSAAVGEPYQHATPGAWAERWLASKRFVLVDINPRQVAVPYVNRISRTKVTATMEAAADSVPPIVVDVNLRGIGKTGTGYVPSVIVVDGKTRHRALVMCGRDRIAAWVGEKALAELQARAAVRKTFVIEKIEAVGRKMSKIEIEAMLMRPPTGGSPVAVTRQDTGDGGSRPIGSPHRPIGGPRMSGGMPVRVEGTGGAGAGASSGGASAGGGPGGGVSGMNPMRRGIYGDQADPSDRGQMLDPSDKEQFSHGAPKEGDPNIQSPGDGSGPRTRPSTGSPTSEMGRKGVLAGPIKVKKIVTDKKKRWMQAVAPPGRESQVLKLKKKFGEDSAMPYKIAWSQKNRGHK